MIIALDPGFGNTKVSVNGALSVLPSAVSRPKQVGMAGIGMKTADASAQIDITGAGLFAVGSNAWLWGLPIDGMDYSTLGSEARLALFYAGLSQVVNPGSYSAELVIGLPVPLLQSEAEANTVVSQLKETYKNAHHSFTAAGGSYDLDITRLHVIPQPAGAWNDWAIDEDLHPRKGAKESEVAILDIGMNTLDLYVIQNTRFVPAYLDGEKVGVRRLLDRLNGRHGISESDALMRSGRLKPSREDLEFWLSGVLSVVERAWPSLSRFTAVIPVGGGVLILGDLLRRALEDRGALISWPDDPITANVRGMYKWLAYNAARR